MRKAVFIIAVFTVLSCSSNKSSQPINETITLLGNCPKKSTCSITILKNKKIVTQLDSVGKIHYELKESFTTNVVKYNFIKNFKGNIQDADYSEEVILELKKNETDFQLKDKELQKTNLLYGRFCFCDDHIGYFKVIKGILTNDFKENIKKYYLIFNTDEVPQITTNIEFIIQ